MQGNLFRSELRRTDMPMPKLQQQIVLSGGLKTQRAHVSGVRILNQDRSNPLAKEATTIPDRHLETRADIWDHLIERRQSWATQVTPGGESSKVVNYDVRAQLCLGPPAQQEQGEADASEDQQASYGRSSGRGAGEGKLKLHVQFCPAFLCCNMTLWSTNELGDIHSRPVMCAACNVDMPLQTCKCDQ